MYSILNCRNVNKEIPFLIIYLFFVTFNVPQLCQAKGFVCEFCGNDKDIIFPFQLSKCQRCEGEPSLLVAGLGGSRAPSPRPSIPLTWRDWKISKPRRLAWVLSKDRREGEGGEEDLDLDVGQRVKSEEERGDAAEEKQGRGGISHASTPGKLVKAFFWNKDNEEEQEMTEGTESEREEETKCDKGGEEGGNGQRRKVYSKQRAMSKEKGDGHARREKVNLLKVLHIDRLKKSVSKGDRRDSDSESMESQDEIGQERKHLWKVSRLATFTKGFSKREMEDEAKTEVKEEEERLLEKVIGTQEEGKARREAEDNNEISDKGQTAETEKPGAENVEKFTLVKLLKPLQLSAVFSRGKSKGEEDSGESDGKREMVTGKEEPAIINQNTWRSRKTRRARRVTRGQKIREGTEKESTTEGGDSAEIDDEDTEKGGGQE